MTITRIIEAPPLLAGDQIEFSVTHEVNIAGEKAWVKAGVVSKVLGTETPDEAVARVVGFVVAKVLEGAQATAESIS